MTKRKDADAAYERQEDQRALAKVLAAATDFSVEMKEWAGAVEIDELDRAIDRVRTNMLKIEPTFLGLPVRVAESAIPGQITIEGAVVGEPRELGAPMAEVFDVPKQCPACGENMLLVWGGSWTPMTNVTRSDGSGERALQCSFCAHIEWVPAAAYEAVLAERRSTVGASDKRPVKIIPPKRTRGAG